MCTLTPLGISIVFPCLILGVKKLTDEVNRPFGFQLFFAATITGAIFGGPIVDWVRHDYKYTTWHYTHHNDELDRDEDRVQEFSAWRTIAFIGFCLNIILLFLLCCYDQNVEKRYQETDVDWDEIEKLTFCQIFKDLCGD